MSDLKHNPGKLRERILSRWGEIVARRNGWVLLGALIVTIIAIALAANLKITTRWSDLLPLDDPKVQEFDKILKEYSTASNSLIVVKGDEKKIKAFADDIAPRIKNLGENVKRVDYKMNREFFKNHGMMLTKAKDLEDTVEIFKNLNLIPLIEHINDNFEKTYVGSSEKISSKEKEDNAIAFLDGMQYWLQTMEKYALGKKAPKQEVAEAAVDRFLMGDLYFISQDKKMLLISVEPTFSITDIERTIIHVDNLQKILDERVPEFNGVEAGLTGMLPLARDEFSYSMADMQTTSVLALILVMALFIISFRIWSTPILAGINLILGIIWAAGFGAIFLSSLNMFTQMFAVILIGLGIDFSVHIISLYSEMRHKGESSVEAMKYTLVKSGSGILTGGLTTAAAFFTLMISNSRGMKEMGLMLGIGIISCMLSSLIVFPAILVSREKLVGKLRKKEAKTVNVEFKFLGNMGKRFSKRPSVYITIGVLITIFFLFQALTVKFNYNILDMEPKGILSVTLQDDLIEAFDMSPDFALVTTKSVEEARILTKKVKAIQSVSLVESISTYIPSDMEQKKRTPLLNRIKDSLEAENKHSPISGHNFAQLIKELKRVDMNVYELGQLAYTGGQDRIDLKCKSLIGDPDDPKSYNYILDLTNRLSQKQQGAIQGLNLFQQHYKPVFRQLALSMANSSPLTLKELPDEITDQFYNKSRNHFLVTIVPKEKVWDLKFLTRFSKQMERIDPGITGTPPMILALMNYISRDGRNAILLSLLVVFFLLLLDFRSIRYTLITMIPLVFGAIWMVGLLKTFGLQFTIINFMGIPMIVGIGIDYGVHLMHRYRAEGKGSIKQVVSSTGKAILVTSLTTMAGFGSLMIAKYRGFGSLGILLVLGVGACFLTTILFLPAILGWIEKRQSIKDQAKI